MQFIKRPEVTEVVEVYRMGVNVKDTREDVAVGRVDRPLGGDVDVGADRCNDSLGDRHVGSDDAASNDNPAASNEKIVHALTVPFLAYKDPPPILIDRSPTCSRRFGTACALLPAPVPFTIERGITRST